MIKFRTRIHYGWIILILGVLTIFSALGLARFGYTMILPSMQQGLELSNTQTGALATGNFIGYLCLALIGGFLASHFSPRRVISLSLLVVGITMLLTATSSNFLTALIWRTLTGMGSGGSNVPMMGLLAAWFATNRRGFATGVAVTGSSLGLIITGMLVPLILNAFNENGWRYCWFILGIIVLLIDALIYLLLRDRAADRGLLPIGAENISSVPFPPHEEATSARFSPFKSWSAVYKSTTVWHLALIYISFGFSYIIYVTFFAKYLQAEAGYTRESAGKLWQMVGWISVVCGILWGWVSDLIGRKYGLALVSFLQGTAYLLFALWRTPLTLSTSAIIFGLTAWSIPAIMASACGDHLGARLAPAALGFITLFFGIGQAVGPTVAGWVADVSGSFSGAYLLATASAFLGALTSLFLKKTS